jgi:hypothetical protein
MIKILIFLHLIFILAFSSKSWGVPPLLGPSIDFNQNPNSIEWKKIDTTHFEIIFPLEVEQQAQRVAHLLEKAYDFVSRSMETYPPKISLILQNQSVNSNGFVTLAPRRSEWYVTPSIDPELTNTEWLKTLAIHEFRHVVQFQKTRQNFNRYYEILLGEIGQALGLSFSLPPWFLEGDAVGIETALTNGGRGRLPLFERDLRTLLLSGKRFDFDKAILRSYEDWVPNHYVYGYFLTSSLRNNYGDLFLSKLANQSTTRSWNPLSFYDSSDRMLKGNFEQFYGLTIHSLLKMWKEQLDKLNPTPFKVVSVEKKCGWTNYNYPMMTSHGEVIALKNGLSFINQFVILKKDSEEVLFYPGVLIQDYPYKIRKDKFAFLELEIDPRWGYRDFSKLKVYDVQKRKEIFSLSKTKYRLAVLNHEATKVLAVNWSKNQSQGIVVIDLKTKNISEFQLPGDVVITSLDWMDENRAIAVAKDRNDLKQLVEIDLSNGRLIEVSTKETTNLGFISVSEGKVLVESPASGIDNIYLFENGAFTQLTSASFGAYAPVLHGSELYYNNYTVNGMEVVTKTLPWNKEEISSESFAPFYEKYAQFEGKDSFVSQLKEAQTYPVQKYSQLRNAYNFHSWMILAPPLTNTLSLVGFSQDLLNKFQLMFGAEYNLNEKSTQGFTSMSWSHYFPVFDLAARFGSRRQDVIIDQKSRENKWEEGVLETGLSLPWQNIYGRFSQNLTMRLFAKVIHVTDRISNDVAELSHANLFSPGLEMSFSTYSRTAMRDLYPSLGIGLNLHAEEGKDVSGGDERGALLNLNGLIYLPGFFKHHSFYHQLAYEKQRDQNYQYASLISFARGTSYQFLNEFTKYSANYTLPLFYPDWNWGRLFYLKRVALNGFFDEINGRIRSFSYQSSSTGWELLLESHFLRLMLPLTWGIRGNYVLTGPKKNENSYELFLSSTLAVF